MRIHQDVNEESSVNLTPMIDVVFLLLIFFLVASRFEEQEKHLPVQLPEVVSAEPISGRKQLTVNVTNKGKYIIVDKTYNEQELTAYIRAYHDKNPHKKVLIRGDGRSQLQYAVRVMGICNKLGVQYKISALLQQQLGS